MIAETRTTGSSRHRIETTRMQRVLERTGFGPDMFFIASVADAGYVISRRGNAPRGSSGTLLCDLDDTIGGTTPAKKIFELSYAAYCRNRGIAVTDPQAVQIIEQTASFSHWAETEDQEEISHPGAFLSALQWTTDALAVPGGDLPARLDALFADLRRIKDQFEDSGFSRPEDPFGFDAPLRTFTPTMPHWSHELETIYLTTFLHPSHIREISDVIHEGTRIFGTVGVFTLGDPVGQLVKLTSMFSDPAVFPFSQIWLTKADKGDFAAAILDCAGKNLLPPESTRPLGAKDAIVVADDDPDALTSILSVNETHPDGPLWLGMRYVLEGGYHVHESWTPVGANRQIRSGTLQPRDILRMMLEMRRDGLAARSARRE